MGGGYGLPDLQLDLRCLTGAGGARNLWLYGDTGELYGDRGSLAEEAPWNGDQEQLAGEDARCGICAGDGGQGIYGGWRCGIDPAAGLLSIYGSD